MGCDHREQAGGWAVGEKNVPFPATLFLLKVVCKSRSVVGDGKGTQEREGAAAPRRLHQIGPQGEPLPFSVPCALGGGIYREHQTPSRSPDGPSQCLQFVSVSRQMRARRAWIIIGIFAFHGSLSFFPDLYLKQTVMDGHVNRKTNSWSPFIYAKNLMLGETTFYHIHAN